MRYEKYYVGITNEHKGLFSQLRGKEAAPNRVPDGDINMINETSTNNGVAKKAASNFVFDAPAITVSVNHAQTVFLQTEDFCASVNILILKSTWLSKMPEIGLYIAAYLKKNNQRYDYSCKISKDKLNDTVLVLPTLDEIDETSPYSDNGFIPDWQYMQERIAELEQERIAELEQERIAELEHYLVASGLNDYELTEEDKSILATELFNSDDATELPSENSCRKEARKFRVGDLFEVLKITNKLSKLKLSNDGKFPVYSSDTANNGIIGFTDTPNYMCSEDVPVYITFGDHTRSFNIVRKSFSVLDNVKILRPQFVAEDEILIYIITKWKKTIPDLGYSRHWKIAKDCVLFLPIQTDTANNPIINPENTYHPEGYIPDWSFMEKYIRAVEKVVIKDVVDWKDEEIKKTKEIVS